MTDHIELLERVGWDVMAYGCWEFRGTRSANYGYVKVDGKRIRAHRLAYEGWVGPIPKGLSVLHSCDNPPCINPEHLRVGTQADNVRDRVERGRSNHSKGEDSPRAKLTWAKVREMRALSGVASQRQLATKFGVSQAQVWNILNDKMWREPQEVGN